MFRKASFGTSTLSEYVNLKLVSRYEYERIGDRGRRFLRKMTFRQLQWIRYIFFFIFSTIGFILSVWIQLFPYDFVTVPRIFYISSPIEIIQTVIPVICINGCLTIIVIIPIFHCGDLAVEYDIVCGDEKIMEFTEEHFVFRLKWLMDKWIKLASQLSDSWFRSIRLWLKFLALLIVIICYLPFAAVHKLSLGISHDAIRNTDIIAYRLFQTFNCEGKQLSYKKLMAKAILYLISSLYYLITMVFAWAFLQLLVRTFLTYIAFFAVHSKYFSAYIGPAVPFLYFAQQAIRGYSQEKVSLSKDIFELRDEIESEVEDYLKASEGHLEILFTMTSKGIDLDLPVRLENIRQVIQAKFTQLGIQHDTLFRGEQQSVFVQFKEYGIDIVGNKKYDIRFSRLDDQLNDLRQKVKEELSHQQQYQLRLKLKPFYHDFENATSDACEVGVPLKFYNYLYYRAPGLTLNFQNLLIRLITIASIALFFFTAVSSFSDMDNITVLTNALSGTLLSYIGMTISISHFTSNELDSQKHHEMLKKNIIDYILGYTFFYTRGKTIKSPRTLKQRLIYNRRPSVRPSRTWSSTVV